MCDELTVFNVQGTHKGDVTVKTEAEDGTAYEFDTTNLLTDGIIRVKSVVTGIELIHNEKGSGTMFDLSGRRVQIPKRGLLIIDGKKKLVQ